MFALLMLLGRASHSSTRAALQQRTATQAVVAHAHGFLAKWFLTLISVNRIFWTVHLQKSMTPRRGKLRSYIPINTSFSTVMAILLPLHAVASCPFKVMEFYFIIKLRTWIPCIQILKFMHISKLNTFFNAIKTQIFFYLFINIC